MSKLRVFQDNKIRSQWDSEQELWYFSVIDVIAALTESDNPQVYWRVFKKRLLDEGNETVTNCNALKMIASDGKMRLTDVATTEISKEKLPKNFAESKKIAEQGGTVAGNARKEIESKTGKKVVVNKNAIELRANKKLQ